MIYDVIIIGAGLSGLSTHHFLKKKHPNRKFLTLESSDRVGGMIKTYHGSDFTAEYGPHGFLDNVEETQELIKDLELEDRVIKAPLKEFVRYVCINGKLVLIPQTLLKVLGSPFMSFMSKVRVLGDLFKRPIKENTTVEKWAEYRFGAGILPLMDAALTGTYAGDISKLGVDDVFPGIRKLELENGSLIKGAIKALKKKKTKQFPSMISFKDGMEELVLSLSKNNNIVMNSKVEKLEEGQGAWEIFTADKQYSARKVVIALDINSSLKLLQQIKKPPVTEVPISKIANVILTFEDHECIPFGFGYLAPTKEKRFALGALFSGHMFKNRIKNNQQMLEILVGGRHCPEKVNLSDEELIEKAHRDVKNLLNLKIGPSSKTVLKHKSGLPQLEIGHIKLKEYRDMLKKEYPRLDILGVGWSAIGMNDMTKDAKRIAFGLQLEDSQARPLYF